MENGNFKQEIFAGLSTENFWKLSRRRVQIFLFYCYNVAFMSTKNCINKIKNSRSDSKMARDKSRTVLY